MEIIDVFKGDAFSVTTLTEQVNRVDHVPNHIGSLGVFTPRPIRTETFGVEWKKGALSVIQTTERGAPLKTKNADKRAAKQFSSVRIGEASRIWASEISGVRGMGENMILKTLMDEVSLRLSGPNGLVADVEATLELHRLGAIMGKVTDADGTTVLEDYYAAFGIAEPTNLNFDLGVKKDGALRAYIQKNVVRAMRKKRKGLVSVNPYAICGDDFWDALISNDEVRDTYLRTVQAASLRESYDGEEFSFGGVTWANFEGSDEDDGPVTIGLKEVKIFANTPGAFEMIQAPGEDFDSVNQLGQPFYSRIIPDRDRNSYVDIEVVAYPMALNRRPELSLKGSTP